MVTQMDKKQSSDQLAITKAAAWAWYERGSWFGHDSIVETNCRPIMTDYTPMPSRYKLEVIKNAESCNISKNNNNTNPLGTDHKKVDESFLDINEIKRLISRDHDCYVESSKLEHHHKLLNDSDPVLQGTKSKRKGKGVNKKRNMFSMGRRIMCGFSSNDVVEHANSLVGGRKHHQEMDVRKDGVVNIRRPLIHG